MSAHARTRTPAPARLALATLLAFAFAAGSALAGTPPPDAASALPHVGAAPAAGEPWFSLGLLGGSTFLDGHLADYQWDTRPRADWGAALRAGRGRASAGLRLWRYATTQSLDLPAGPVAPAVHGTTLELSGRFRVLDAGAASLLACAQAGRLHLGWSPDRVVVTPGGPGTGVTADLRPLDEWIGGGGIAVQVPLAGHWLADLELDRQVFALDTAHRSGGAIVNQRESFGDWSARFELARRFPLTLKGHSR